LPPISTLFPYTTLFRSPGKGKRFLVHDHPQHDRQDDGHQLQHGVALKPFIHQGPPFGPRSWPSFPQVSTPDTAASAVPPPKVPRSEEHTSELQSRENLV